MAVDIGEMLDRLLTEGARHSDDTHDYELTMVPLGDVTLPTGRVVACDPLVDTGETQPFTVSVPPGRYPLRAWVAVACLPARVLAPAGARATVPAGPRATLPASPRGTFPAGPRATLPTGHRATLPVGSRATLPAGSRATLPAGSRATLPAGSRAALAAGPGPSLHSRVEADRHTTALQLVVRDEQVTAWEAALVPDPPFLDEDGFAAFPVDTGIATLADERALKALSTWDYAAVEEAFAPSRPPDPPGALRAMTDPPTGADVVAVVPGCGDGAYATFIGRTSAGEVACFVTDFRVI